MHVLNEDSDSIVTMGVDEQSGMLFSTEKRLHCGSPVCLIYR
jgi:6-phosphogluconolactonase (cycloisomerase 2 family)